MTYLIDALVQVIDELIFGRRTRHHDEDRKRCDGARSGTVYAERS